ncbi:MAG: hypothetical protein AB8H03_08440 [Saprospiraceae bacterium]
MKNSIAFRAITLIVIFLFSNQLIKANKIITTQNSIFDELQYQEMVEVNLELNTSEAFDDRKNPEKHEAIFSYENQFGELQTWNIKVEQRGRFRRMKCENLPPLKLNFKKRDLAEAGLIEFDDMKLVTHCVNNAEEAKQLLVKEYLAYKIYNQITKLSFRVQFVKINYKDVMSGKVDTQYGILIEDTAQLRDRINAEKDDKAFNLSPDKYNSNQIKAVALFNYMIGNSDWSIGEMRNVKVMIKDGLRILVPFDFDFSGLVDAPYVRLRPEHRLASSKERIFLGFREDASDLKSAQRFFKFKRAAIIKTIEDCSIISDDNQREMIRYINSFYDGGNVMKLPMVQ